MYDLRPRLPWGAILLSALGLSLIASVALAHVHVTCNPSQNKIKIRWTFPCSDPPGEGGDREISERGNPPDVPPPDVCLVVQESQQNPPNFANRVTAVGCCTGGDPNSYVVTHGCAEAGGLKTEAVSDGPFASVGFESATDPSSPEAGMRLHVDRIVTPGPTPDIVRVTFLGGVMQARAIGQNEQSFATLKLIVYPDDAAADADSSQLSGAGSAFLGAATLVGKTGEVVPLQGFAASDFTVADDGAGAFTATPVAGLTKIALVPDANLANVSMVGDPKVYDESIVGVGGSQPKILGLALPNPNPSSSSVAFRFSLPQPGPVSLELFDLLGRRIRNWVWPELQAGEHSVTWDGRTAMGARAPTGALLLRITAMGMSINQKVTRLR